MAFDRIYWYLLVFKLKILVYIPLIHAHGNLAQARSSDTGEECDRLTQFGLEKEEKRSGALDPRLPRVNEAGERSRGGFATASRLP